MLVRIGSYNVHAFVGTDGRRDVRRTAAVIRELEPDVIALQEVVFGAVRADAAEPVETLAALSGYADVSAPIERKDGLRFGNAVFTRLPLLDQRRICLAFDGHEPRTALEVLLETGARPLRVLATHLGLKPAERRFQVRKILEHVAGDEQSVTVLLGDFNEWFLFGRPLRWLHGRFGRGPAVATFPSRFPLFALDRVWAHPRPALKSFRAHATAQSRIASDHLPVIAEVDVGETDLAAPRRLSRIDARSG